MRRQQCADVAWFECQFSNSNCCPLADLLTMVFSIVESDLQR